MGKYWTFSGDPISDAANSVSKHNSVREAKEEVLNRPQLRFIINTDTGQFWECDKDGEYGEMDSFMKCSNLTKPKLKEIITRESDKTTVKEKLIKAGIEVKDNKIKVADIGKATKIIGSQTKYLKMKSSGGVTLTDTLENATFFDTEQEANSAASFVINKDKVTVKPYFDNKYGDGFIAEYLA